MEKLDISLMMNQKLTKIDAHSARERRLFNRRKSLKFMWRRECRIVRRLHSLVKPMKQYVADHHRVIVF
jgi:hypothetical protein